MEINYQNTDIESIGLPTAIKLNESAKDIINLLKDTDVKCIIESDGKETKVTFDVNDLEKMDKILQPVINKQLDSAVEVPKLESKEKLIPVANAISNLYNRKINGRNSSIKAHQKHIDLLADSIKKSNNKKDMLSGRNDMMKKLANTFPIFKSPINALIMINEKKIERLITNVKKYEKQMAKQNTTIDKLNKSVTNFTLKKKTCQSLSDMVKSFSISDKTERNQSYLTSLSSFNANMQQMNLIKINSCNEAISHIRADFGNLSPAQKDSAQERINKLNETKSTLEKKNKVLQSANPDINVLLAKLNDNSTSAVVDKAEATFEQALENGGQSMDNIMSSVAIRSSCNVSPTASEIAQVEVIVFDNINDRDRDGIADKIDNSFTVKDEKGDVQEKSDNQKEKMPDIMPKNNPKINQ